MLLSQAESLALPLLPKLQSGALLPQDEKDKLALFIVLLIRRPGALLDHFEREIARRTSSRKGQLALIESMMPQLQKRFSDDEIEFARKAAVKESSMFASTRPRQTKCKCGLTPCRDMRTLSQACIGRFGKRSGAIRLLRPTRQPLFDGETMTETLVLWGSRARTWAPN
jgi:hypothetical protein